MLFYLCVIQCRRWGVSGPPIRGVASHHHMLPVHSIYLLCPSSSLSVPQLYMQLNQSSHLLYLLCRQMSNMLFWSVLCSGMHCKGLSSVCSAQCSYCAVQVAVEWVLFSPLWANIEVWCQQWLSGCDTVASNSLASWHLTKFLIETSLFWPLPEHCEGTASIWRDADMNK